MEEVDVGADNSFADLDQLRVLDAVTAQDDQFARLLGRHSVVILEAVSLQLRDYLLTAGDSVLVVIVGPHDVRRVVHVY